MQNIFKIDAIRAIRSVRVTTERLARVMKNDALSRKRDYQQIKELNYRLARVIPIIPGRLGAAGAIFGVGAVASSSGGLLLPPFPPFGGLPDVRPGSGPKGPGPRTPVPSPTPGPIPPVIAREEEVEVPIPERVPENVPVPTPTPAPIPIPTIPYPGPGVPGSPEVPVEPEVPAEPEQPPVPVPPKRKEPEEQPGVKPEEEPIPLPDPPPPPIPLTPPFPIPRRKKEEEEEKELVPTAMSLYEFELALRSRRQQEKGADPAWLAPYIAYLAEFFRRNKAARGTAEGFFNPAKYPLGGAVQLPDGGVLTVNPVGNPFDRQPRFKYYNGIEKTKSDKNARQVLGVMNMIQAVMSVMGPFAGFAARRPGQTTPRQPSTVPDPNYVPPASTGPLIPPRTPGSVIVPTKPGGGPLVPAPQPTRGALPPARGDASTRTIDVTPTAKTVRRRGDREGVVEFLGTGSTRKVEKTFSAQERAALEGYSNRQLFDIINNRSMPKSTRDAAQDILNRDMQRNVVGDPSAVQGPAQTGSNVKEIIQPIVIFRGKK